MLKTVRIPEEMAPAFAEAEELVRRYFDERRDDPRRGNIESFGERYVLVRAAALSVEFSGLVESLYGPGRRDEAADFARNILFDMAHSIGKSDARNFHGKMQLTDPIARLFAGPIHFSHSGWAFVDISAESRPTTDGDFYLLYDHPYSFDADAWLRADRAADFPVCSMNAGYSSGWCEESFGVTLVASEILCRARGDDCCRFIMAPPGRVEAHVERYLAERTHRGLRRCGYQTPTSSRASAWRRICAGAVTSWSRAWTSAPPSCARPTSGCGGRWRSGSRWSCGSARPASWRRSGGWPRAWRTTSTTSWA